MATTDPTTAAGQPTTITVTVTATVLADSLKLSISTITGMLGVGVVGMMIFALLGCCILTRRPKYKLAYSNRAEELEYLERTRLPPEAAAEEDEDRLEHTAADGAEGVGLLSVPRMG